MRTINRLRAAWQAFKNPTLVGDGEFLQGLVVDLYRQDREALLRGSPCGDRVDPVVEMLPRGARDWFFRCWR